MIYLLSTTCSRVNTGNKTKTTSSDGDAIPMRFFPKECAVTDLPLQYTYTPGANIKPVLTAHNAQMAVASLITSSHLETYHRFGLKFADIIKQNHSENNDFKKIIDGLNLMNVVVRRCTFKPATGAPLSPSPAILREEGMHNALELVFQLVSNIVLTQMGLEKEDYEDFIGQQKEGDHGHSEHQFYARVCLFGRFLREHKKPNLHLP
ncbi:ribosomal protein L23 [Acrasis kona]|uniref:Ribosomal protein L23 n=1 Tax=Acrasis kona TaxID=1008807 RepID=A0AAW2Z2X7_9EUKA